MIINSFSPFHTFFTSDSHFYHHNIMELCKRPFADVEEMNETLIANWNAVVKRNDIVFHLGDFCFGGTAKWKETLGRLNGKIHLVPGNHDIEYLNQVSQFFESVELQRTIYVDGRQIILNHYPFMNFSGCKNRVWQAHGHIHTLHDGTSPKLSAQQLSVMYPTQYDVGADHNDYRPISYEELKQKILGQMEMSGQ